MGGYEPQVYFFGKKPKKWAERALMNTLIFEKNGLTIHAKMPNAGGCPRFF